MDDMGEYLAETTVVGLKKKRENRIVDTITGRKSTINSANSLYTYMLFLRITFTNTEITSTEELAIILNFSSTFLALKKQRELGFNRSLDIILFKASTCKKIYAKNSKLLRHPFVPSNSALFILTFSLFYFFPYGLRFENLRWFDNFFLVKIVV